MIGGFNFDLKKLFKLTFLLVTITIIITATLLIEYSYTLQTRTLLFPKFGIDLHQQSEICNGMEEIDPKLREIMCDPKLGRKPFENNVQLINSQKFFRLNSIFLGEYGSLETSVRCVGPMINQSCLYKNLYYVNSTFIVLITKNRTLPVLDVRVLTFGTTNTSPKIIRFNSYPELEAFVREIIDPIVLPDVTLSLGFSWIGNVGHTLFDALYPAYVAIIRFPPRHLRPFRLFSPIDECTTCRDEDILNRFAGLGMVKQYVLNEMSNNSWYVFDEFVMGGGMMCQRCTQPNLQLPGGVELDGSRLYRKRMYAQHGVIPPPARTSNSAEGRSPYDVLRAYVILNKRFTRNDINEIDIVMAEINNYTRMHQTTNISINGTKLKWPLINIRYLDYSRIQDHKRKLSRFTMTPVDARSPTYELNGNYLSAQLRILRTMDIHITGPGTGQMYQTFLPDGSVVINVGGLLEATPETGNRSYGRFMEQYMTSGAPYLKGLYYPINERPKGLKREILLKLIRKAAKLIMDGFIIPVNPTESLAPDGKLFIEMCARDKQFCDLVTLRAPGTNFGCMNFWTEELIHEVRSWRGENDQHGYRKTGCRFNHTLLHELREKYDIFHYEVN